jgi:radical SAM protein with 4Fe4S-binding SPASM domain
LVEPLGRGANIAHQIDKKLMKLLVKQFQDLTDTYQNSIKLELIRTTSCADDEYLNGCKGDNFLTITSDGRLGTCPWLMKARIKPQDVSLLSTPFKKAREIVIDNMRNYLAKRADNLNDCNNCAKRNLCLKGRPAVSADGLYDPICKLVRR